MNPIGLYLHIPFCKGKCPYCDFYSIVPNGDIIERYSHALRRKIEKKNLIYDSVYFGGGTPSQLGTARIAEIMSSIKRTDDCESTLECNPSDAGAENCEFDFAALKACGINRISMGLQSAIDSERRFLGRRSSSAEAARAVERAQNAGITNISLDLMLGIEGQSIDGLRQSIKFCSALGATHVSAYILKLEQGTPLYTHRNSLNLPNEEETCNLYLCAVEELAKEGFAQYEISNFARPGFESRHNLKYWRCEEYLGIGCAAHSFLNGKRFYYERSIDSFLNGAEPIDDGDGGDTEEFIMLALRLNEGLIFSEYQKRYGMPISPKLIEKATALEKHGLMTVTEKGVSLTPEGFLVSNSIIADLIG